MSLQLPAILSPPTSCIPALALTVSCRRSGCRSRLAPSRVGFRFWASPFPSRLANASGRIVFNMVLFMDWQFVSGCSPPRLSTTQLPSTTDSQCSVRWGLSPHCWCALSGALGRSVPDRRDHRIELPGSTGIIVHRRFGTNRPTIPHSAIDDHVHRYLSESLVASGSPTSGVIATETV
jgi:hypothetical protein